MLTAATFCPHVLAAACLCLALTAGCGGARSEEPSQADQASLTSDAIVFSRDRDLYVMYEDGSGLRQLARNAGAPAVSPDARTILFVRNSAIWSMNRDGSGQAQLTTGHQDSAPAWSPDGGTIYLTRRTERTGEYGYEFSDGLFRMRADGSAVRQITQPPRSDHGTCHEGAAPSPDGRTVAYSDFSECDRGGFEPDIDAVTPEGDEADLGEFDVFGWDPAWSGDGRVLAHASDDEGGEPTGIWLATSDGSPASRIARGWSTDPAWSPANEWIAFVRVVTFPTRYAGDIWLVRPDGTGLRRLSKTRADEGDPAWLPRTTTAR